MTVAIGIRGDFTALHLRELARGARCLDQTRRLLALAEIYDGRSRSEAARLGGVRLAVLSILARMTSSFCWEVER
jgi:hypothetical protein